MLVIFRTPRIGSRFIRGVIVLVGGTALAQAIGIAVSPILSRIYTPADFGTFAVYVSMLSILSGAACLRYELAIPIARTERIAKALLLLCAVVALSTSGALELILILSRGELLRLSNAEDLARYSHLLPLGLLGIGVYRALSYWAVRINDYRILASTRVVQGIGQAVVQLGFGLVGVGPLGLVLGHLVGNTSGIIRLAKLVPWQPLDCWRDTIREVSDAGRHYRRFPLLSSSSAILNAIGLYAPPLILATLYGPASAGLFALAQRAIAFPSHLVGQAVGKVFFGEVSKRLNTDAASIPPLFLALAGRLSMIAVFPALGLALWGPAIFVGVFGSAWGDAGRFAQFLSLVLLLQFVVSPLSQLLSMLERQDMQLWWDMVRAVMVSLGMVGAAWAGLDASAAVLCYSVAMAVCYCGMFVVAYVVLLRHVRQIRSWQGPGGQVALDRSTIT